jgi:hypothetical protein
MAFVPSIGAHNMFDFLAGTQAGARNRTDRIQKRVIDRVQSLFDATEIKEVVSWSVIPCPARTSTLRQSLRP